MDNIKFILGNLKAGIIPMGEFDIREKYTERMAVEYQGATYICIKNCVGITPENKEFWQMIAKKGDDGEDGDKGDKGDDGKDGGKGNKGDDGEDGKDGGKGDKGDDGGDGKDGKDGEKGDKGEDGETPEKGIDYFDGEDGERGPKGIGTVGPRGYPGTPALNIWSRADGVITPNDSEDRLDISEIRATGSAGLKLYDDGGNGIFVKDGGNVGIGTTSPDKKLTINQSADSEGIKIYGYDDVSDAYLHFYINSGGVATISAYHDYARDIYFADGAFMGSNKDFSLGGSQEYSFRHQSSDDKFLIQSDNQGNTRMVIDTSGNVGIGTTSPDTKLQVVGTTKFGDDNTNYASFAADGELSLTGTARVTRHLRVGAGQWDHGVSAPTEGHDGPFVYLAFNTATDDEVHYTVIVPHRWDETEDIEFVVDWYYTGAQDNGNVCWNLEYKAVKDGEIVTGGSTTIVKTTAGNHTTGQLMRTTFTTKILAANVECCDTLALRLFRDVSEDTLAVDAKLLNTHFHFTQNKLGKAT